MRITLDLDGDVLASAKEIARREKKTVGKVVSELAPRGGFVRDHAERLRADHVAAGVSDALLAARVAERLLRRRRASPVRGD
jgi:hypothetical protein